MKKIMFAVMATMAIGFTACGNKSQAPAEAPADTVEAVSYNADDEAAATISQLTEQIEAKDATKLQEVLTAVQEKIKQILGSNPEVAKEYIAKVQQFLKYNADKIKAFAGDNEAINSAINSLTATPAESIVSGLSSAIDNLGDKASEAAEDAKKAAADKANEMKEDAKKKTGEAVDAAKDKVKEGLGI
jgi:hypothetical protein